MRRPSPARPACTVQASVQPRFSRTLLALFIATGATVALPNTSKAADLSWDTNAGNTAVDGGTGTWDAATANWTSDAGVTNQAWGAGDNAVFGGTAGTVTVSGTQAVDYITVQTGGYALQGGALTFSTTNASGVTVETGTTTISTDLTSTNGFNKAGDGTLVLSGTNSLAGTLDVSRGNLTATNANALSGVSSFVMQSTNSALNVDLGGATLSVDFFTVNSPGSSSLNNGTVSISGLGQLGYSTINAVLAGSGELRKVLPYLTTLNGVNTLTGPVNVNEGQLAIGATGSLLNTSGITIAAAGTLNINGAGGNAISDTGTINNSGNLILTGSNETLGSIFGSGNINLNNNTLTTGDAANAEIAGVISGSGNLIKRGSGTLTLTGTNTATGTLTTSAGTTVLSGSWAGDVQNNANFNLIGTSTVNGTVHNNSTGSITNNGGGNVTLTGLSNFIANGAIGSAAGSINVNTDNLTYRNGHNEIGNVSFAVSDTITEERTTGPTWQGTGFTSNFATAEDGVFTTGGDFTTTGGFTHDSSAALTVSNGDTMTVSSLTNTAGSVINLQTNASLVGTGNTTNNAGTVNVAGGGSLVELTGAYNNLATGVVNFNDAAAKDFDVQAGVINNDGTLNFNAGNTTVNSGGGAIQNNATGDINIADGATLNASGDTITNAGSIDMAGTSSSLTVGTLTNNTGGTVNAQGTLTGTVVNQGSGDFNITGNMISLSLDITNTDTATLDAGAGTITIMRNLTNTTTSGTGVTVATGAGLNAAVIQNGLANGSAASLITNNGGLYSDTSITNHAGATLNSNTANSLVAYENSLTNNGTVNMQGRIGGQSVINSGAGATFNVVGNLNAINTNPLNAFTNQNSAVLNVSGGTFWVDALTNTSGGTGTSLATAGVQVAADGGLVVAGALNNNGAGTLNNAGSINADSITNAVGSTLVSSGTLDTTSAASNAINNLGTMNIGATGVALGGLDNSGTLTSTGELNEGLINSGTATLSNQVLGAVQNNTGGQLSVAGDLSMDNSLTNAAGALIDVDTGTLSGITALTNRGTGSGNGAGTAGFEIDAGATVSAADVLNTDNATLYVAGTLVSGNAILNSAGAQLASIGALEGDLSNNSILSLQGLLDGDLINDGGLTTITGALAGTGGADTGTVTNRNAGSLVLNNGSSFTFDWLDNDALSSVTLNGATLAGNVINTGTLFGAGVITRQLNNNGTVDLVNGVTGDELRINGGLSGAGTYNLDLDLTSATPGVDRLVITGDTTGELALAFNLLPGTPALLNSSLVIVDVDESANNDFTYSTSGLPQASGAVALFASQATPNGDIVISGGASPTLGALMEGVAQVESLTRLSTGRLGLYETDICANTGVSARVSSGETTTDASTVTAQQSADMEVVSDYQGLEIEARLGCPSQMAGWDLSYNLLAGINDGATTQKMGGSLPSATRLDFDQHYAALASSAQRGALTAELQLRYGHTQYKPDVSAGSQAAMMGLSDDTFKAQSVSLDSAVSYHLPLGQGGFAVVPQGGVSISSTRIDSLNFANGETMEADDYTATSSFVGATLQYNATSASGQGAFSAYLGGNLHNSLSEGQKVTLTDASGSQVDFTTSGVDDFAQISAGMDYTSQLDANRLFSVGLRADSRQGDGVDGYTVALQVGLHF